MKPVKGRGEPRREKAYARWVGEEGGDDGWRRLYSFTRSFIVRTPPRGLQSLSLIQNSRHDRGVCVFFFVPSSCPCTSALDIVVVIVVGSSMIFRPVVGDWCSLAEKRERERNIVRQGEDRWWREEQKGKVSERDGA